MAEGGVDVGIRPPEQQNEDLEKHIQKQEQELGIEKDSDRLIEASLFIDKKFLDYALITGQDDKPERIFGDEAWASYLDARLAAKDHAWNDLTPDFILKLHRKLTKRSDPEHAGQIRTVPERGAAYDQPGTPATYTEEELRAIKENPQLRFRPGTEGGYDKSKGFIYYPPHGERAKVKPEIEQELQKICDWYNEQIHSGRYNPDIVAGVLQHRLVSLHPFTDGNGTLSRILMNWSLENDNEAPSILEEPSDDITTDEETWIAKVTEGSKRYEEAKKQQGILEQAGIEAPAAIFGLGKDKAFFDYVYKHMTEAPQLPANGGKLNHTQYEEYLKGLSAEMKLFDEQASITSTAETSEGRKELHQGGLITQEFMQFALNRAGQPMSQDIRDRFFQDVPVYRGGMVEEEIDDKQILDIFQSYTAAETAYRPLKRQGLSAMSIKKTSAIQIQESMDYYNKLIASSYIKDLHPDIALPYKTDYPYESSVRQTVQYHTEGGPPAWISPFASTSLAEYQGRYWANRFGFGALHAGIAIKTSMPQEGSFATFRQSFPLLGNSVGIGYEVEILATGAIIPASIDEISVYRDEGYSEDGPTPSMTARRTATEGTSGIEIADKRGEFVVKRQYLFNQETNTYELAEEEQTDIPSKKPTPEEPQMQGQEDIADWEKDLLEGGQKEAPDMPNAKTELEKQETLFVGSWLMKNQANYPTSAEALLAAQKAWDKLQEGQEKAPNLDDMGYEVPGGLIKVDSPIEVVAADKTAEKLESLGAENWPDEKLQAEWDKLYSEELKKLQKEKATLKPHHKPVEQPHAAIAGTAPEEGGLADWEKAILEGESSSDIPAEQDDELIVASNKAYEKLWATEGWETWTPDKLQKEYDKLYDEELKKTSQNN